ncbi:MAG: amidohydrolase family protein, partial [Kangiellaceae bacterium]|nr:amidohydrolase family protein [Kangiellaceae bacterium]
TLEYAQRLTSHQRAVLVSEDCKSVGQNLYVHAAKEGANTVNQNVGEIGVGMRADFVVLDMEHPSLYLKEESFILDSAIFACSEMPVKDVMVNGEWKIQNQCHDDQETITQDYLNTLKKLTQ